MLMATELAGKQISVPKQIPYIERPQQQPAKPHQRGHHMAPPARPYKISTTTPWNNYKFKMEHACTVISNLQFSDCLLDVCAACYTSVGESDEGAKAKLYMPYSFALQLPRGATNKQLI